METEYYESIFKFFKIFLINFFTIYTSIKIINMNNFENKLKNFIVEVIIVFIMSCLNIFIEIKSSKFYSVVYLILFLTIYLCKTKMINIGYSLGVNIISLGLNFILFF